MPTGPLQSIQSEQNELNAERDAFIRAAEGRGGKGFTAAERTRLGAIETRLTALDRETMRLEIEREVRHGEPAIDGVTDAMLGLSYGSVGSIRPRHAARIPAGHSYAELFGPATDSGGFGSFEDFLSTVHSGRADPRLAPSAAATTTVGSTGGFLVPVEYSAELFDGAIESEIVRPRARVYPMTGDKRKISGFSAKDHTDGSIYGFTARWMEEAAMNTDQTPKAVQIELNAHKLALFTQASNELASDGETFESQLGTAMRLGIGFSLDQAFLFGTGAGRPAGALSASNPARIVVAKETGQLGATLLYENVTKMLARLHPALFNESVWVASQTLIPQLLVLTVPVGTGGTVIPVLREDRNGGFTILTRPVTFTEKVPALGTEGDISLVAFSQYAIGMRKEFVMDRSQGPGWREDLSSYRGIVRVDGQSRWTGPVTPVNGDTLSWAVTLAARA